MAEHSVMISAIWFLTVNERTGKSTLHLLKTLNLGVTRGNGIALESEAVCGVATQGQIDVRPDYWDTQCETCMKETL